MQSLEVSPERKGKEERTALTPPQEESSVEVVRLKEEVSRLKQRLESKFSPVARGGDGTPAQQDALARAIAVQTQTLQAALKLKDNKHSVVRIQPTFKWPKLGDDGPDSKDVEEF